ncbi:MAG TPA: aldo/keto reductase [Myxococcota bacterium]|jgi:aryl-alcohol dehydrogenase-like predicted oxidoreductase|nr:aldo/keto reductase [Myxococcota bacterium]
MQTRKLGPGGPDVSAIGLGGMPLSIVGRPDEDQGVRVIHAAIDAGMTLVDTADVYCLDDADLGHNERLIARAVHERSGRQHVVVATKGGLERPRGAWTTNGRPEHLRAACERSLQALGVQAIELYQLHAPDDAVPFADSVGALAALRAAGKIVHVGLSNVDVAEIDEARAIVPIATVQNRCNPFDATSFENGVVAHCEALGIAFLAHSPVGGHRGHARVAADPVLAAVARRRGATPYQVCLAWLLALSPAVVPIPGASRPASARSSAAAAEVHLDDADLAELQARFPAVRVRAGARA